VAPHHLPAERPRVWNPSTQVEAASLAGASPGASPPFRSDARHCSTPAEGLSIRSRRWVRCGGATPCPPRPASSSPTLRGPRALSPSIPTPRRCDRSPTGTQNTLRSSPSMRKKDRASFCITIKQSIRKSYDDGQGLKNPPAALSRPAREPPQCAPARSRSAPARIGSRGSPPTNPNHTRLRGRRHDRAKGCPL
jgi:hypothetical protein